MGHSLPTSDGKRGQWQLEKNSVERLKEENQGQVRWSDGERGWGGVLGPAVTVRSLKFIVKAGGSHQRILSRGDDTIQFTFLKSPCSPSRNSASVLWQGGPPEPVEKKQGRREGTSGENGAVGLRKMDRWSNTPDLHPSPTSGAGGPLAQR